MRERVRNLKAAWNLVARTYPLTVARAGMALAFTLIAMVYVGVTGRIVWAVAQAVPWLGLTLLLTAMVGLFWLFSRYHRHTLGHVKSAQIAVMSRLLEGDTLPEHTSYLKWGRQMVQERWGTAEALCSGCEVVDGSVRGFSGLVYTLSSWLPQETPKAVVYLLGGLVQHSMGCVDEAILARTFWRRQETVWANVRDGVVLYALAWRALLTNALVCTALRAIPALLILVALPVSMGMWLAAVSPAASLAGMVIGIQFGLVFKSALLNSVAMAGMIVAYREATADLEPDAVLKSRLAYVSKFDELTRLAEGQAEAAANGSSLRLKGREVTGS